MGPDVKLRLQLPVQLITSKRFGDSKATKQSQLQYLRLWKFGRRQILMFFANASSNTYKEYRSPFNCNERVLPKLTSTVDYFRPAESKSKTVVKLNLHLPGTLRSGSKSKGPIMIAEHSANSQLPEAGLLGETDFEDLKGLDFLTVDFGRAEGN